MDLNVSDWHARLVSKIIFIFYEDCLGLMVTVLISMVMQKLNV